MVWTKDAVDRLTALANDGLTAAAIAAQLSDEYGTPLTTNAVMGKCFRTGIALKRSHGAALPKSVVAPANTSVEAPVMVKPVTFAELQSHHCKWPVDDGSPQSIRFCGARRTPGRPYCEEHLAKAWRKP